MEIKITKIDPERMKLKPEDESKLGFGQIFTDHFFIVEYDNNEGWHNASIEPLRPLSLDPAAMCLHYGQEIFEGMKAYRGENGSVYLFRPEENMNRMNLSAERLCMPPIDVDLFMEALKKLVTPGKRLDTSRCGNISVYQADNDRYRVFPRSTSLRQIPVLYNCGSGRGILSGRLQSDEDICEREICQGGPGRCGTLQGGRQLCGQSLCE